MKKNIFALVAVLMAVVFSAFTISPEPSRQTTTEDNLYWYYVDQDGNLGAAISSSQLTKTDILGMIVCDDTVDPDCARGYSTPQSGFGLPAPAVSGADKHIRFDN